MTVTKVGGTQTVRRATLLIRSIAAQNDLGIRLTDLAERLPLDRTTIHRILRALVAENLIAQDPDTKRYYLGQMLFELGLAARRRYNLGDIYRPILARVAETTGDTVFLNIRSGNDAVCIERQHGAYPVRVFTLEVGDRRPLGTSSSGIAILSALPDPEIRRIVAENESALVKRGKKPLRIRNVLEAVRLAREKGYTFHSGDFTDARTIAVAATNSSGQPFAAISVTAIPSRMTDDRQRRIATAVKQSVKELEQALAGQDISVHEA